MTECVRVCTNDHIKRELSDCLEIANSQRIGACGLVEFITDCNDLVTAYVRTVTQRRLFISRGLECM